MGFMCSASILSWVAGKRLLVEIHAKEPSPRQKIIRFNREQAVKDAREREQLFNEHMKERERKEKELRRAELKKKKAAFLALLESNKSIKVRLLPPNRKIRH